MHGSTNRRGRRGTRLLAGVLILAVVGVALLGAVSAVAALRTNQSLHEWDETFGSWDEVNRRFPATEVNASALELERIAAGLGIDVIPRELRSDDPANPRNLNRPTEAQSDSFGGLVGNVFGLYGSRMIERPQRGGIDAPPAALVMFVEQHGQQIDALRWHLLTGDVPVWGSDLSLLYEAPKRNLLGQINLHKLLLNLAIERLHAGDRKGALANIESSWRLSQSLRNSPILIDQCIFIAATTMQIGALRHVPDVPEIWIKRLGQHDFRASFLDALKFEGWAWLHQGDSLIWPPDSWRQPAGHTSPAWWRVASLAVRPYARLCLADASEAWRQRIVNLERVDPLCDHDLAPHDAELRIEVPRWNLVGKHIAPGLSVAISRLARLELDLELTLLLLRLDAERRANDGTWPTDLPDVVDSATCTGDEWNLTPTDEGLQVALSRDVNWSDQVGLILPTRAVTP